MTKVPYLSRADIQTAIERAEMRILAESISPRGDGSHRTNQITKEQLIAMRDTCDAIAKSRTKWKRIRESLAVTQDQEKEGT